MKKNMTLRKKTHIKLLFRSLFILLAGVLIFLICNLTVRDAVYDTKKTVCTYIFGLFLLLWVVYATKFFQLLLASDWDGEIKTVRLRLGWHCIYAIVDGSTLRPTVYIDLTVKKDDGREVKITYDFIHISTSYYVKGAKVTYKKGAKYLVYKDSPNGKYMCPLCADTLDENRCSRCRIIFKKSLGASYLKALCICFCFFCGVLFFCIRTV